MPYGKEKIVRSREIHDGALTAAVLIMASYLRVFTCIRLLVKNPEPSLYLDSMNIYESVNTMSLNPLC